MTTRLFFLTSALFIFLGVSHAHEILVNTSDGEIFVFDVDPTTSLAELQNKVAHLSNGNLSDFVIEFPAEGASTSFSTPLATHSQGSYLGHPRNFLAEVSPEEKSDIRFIITTLANKSLIAVALAKSDLEAAGDRIDHIHPLRFLITVFTDEELKVGIRNIRARGWIWNHFIGGLKDCLAVETRIGNMKEEHIGHFSRIVKIESKLIIPALSQQRWEEFVDLLITHIPRSGNQDRYDT